MADGTDADDTIYR